MLNWDHRSGVNGHFDHSYNRPWVSIDTNVIDETARIVGAKPCEVAIMNSLTANLHFLMIAMYTPNKDRFKILMETKAFPSDYFAIESQVKLHGLDPKDAIICLEPRDGEHVIQTQDILDIIQKEGHSIALVMMGGVQYYTGQYFEMEKITKAAQEQGCMVGFDLAHAVGNVPVQLHDWGVDFACWCTYKYLNSGPGSIGGAFIHEKHANDFERTRLLGWWGTDPSTKFQMCHEFKPIPGPMGYRLSNPCVLAVVSLLGSLKVFGKTSMTELREKSLRLTGYLESRLNDISSHFSAQKPFKIITPTDPEQRGCQLSLLFQEPVLMEFVFAELQKKAIICDERRPSVIRISPAPLYNTFQDVYVCTEAIRDALELYYNTNSMSKLSVRS